MAHVGRDAWVRRSNISGANNMEGYRAIDIADRRHARTIADFSYVWYVGHSIPPQSSLILVEHVADAIRSETQLPEPYGKRPQKIERQISNTQPGTLLSCSASPVVSIKILMTSTSGAIEHQKNANSASANVGYWPSIRLNVSDFGLKTC